MNTKIDNFFESLAVLNCFKGHFCPVSNYFSFLNTSKILPGFLKKPLIFFDNGASSQKPKVVLEKIKEIYEKKYANIHRGIYDLSQKATEEYESSRKKIQKFLNAKSEKEIIFVRGATEGINLVAESYGFKNFKKGDEVILTQLEHHSNIVPWQILKEKKILK